MPSLARIGEPFAYLVLNGERRRAQTTGFIGVLGVIVKRYAIVSSKGAFNIIETDVGTDHRRNWFAALRGHIVILNRSPRSIELSLSLIDKDCWRERRQSAPSLLVGLKVLPPRSVKLIEFGIVGERKRRPK